MTRLLTFLRIAYFNGALFAGVMFTGVGGVWNGTHAANAQAGRACELALVLALDSSLSVDEGEYELQLKGLAAALVDPEIRQLIAGMGGLALMAFEWSGRTSQDIIINWQLLETEADVAQFSLALQGHQRVNNNSSTSMGNALGFAAGRFGRLPQNCSRHVIDVSGDGAHNDGLSPQDAYRQFDFSRVVVNGLVITGAHPDPEAYYRKNVLHGEGAFLIVARNFADYQRAIKQKLLREIGSKNLSGLLEF